jgi:sulfur carrier protein
LAENPRQIRGGSTGSGRNSRRLEPKFPSDTLSLTLTLLINGQNREFADLPAPSTLQRLVESLSLKSDRIAIELNGNIVTRAQWLATPLNDGDKLEIVHFVGGG